MIIELRKRHRLFFTFIAPCFVCLYVLGLYFRRSLPPYPEGNFPAALSSASQPRKGPQDKTLLLSKKTMRLGKVLTVVRTWKLGSRYWLSLHMQEQTWPEPDLLLYVQKEVAKELSSEAYLLGALTDKKEAWFMLPQDKSAKALYGQKSIFILYSLGHSRIIARFHSQGKLP